MPFPQDSTACFTQYSNRSWIMLPCAQCPSDATRDHTQAHASLWPAKLCRWFLQTVASTCAALYSGPLCSLPWFCHEEPCLSTPTSGSVSLSLRGIYLCHPWFLTSLCLLGSHRGDLLVLVSESEGNIEAAGGVHTLASWWLGSLSGPCRVHASSHGASWFPLTVMCIRICCWRV